MINTQTAGVSNSIVTTTRIQHEGKTQLSISFDFTSLVNSTSPCLTTLQSRIDQVTNAWWSSLTPAQKSLLAAQGMSLRISAHYRE